MPSPNKTYRLTADGAQAQNEFKKTGEAGEQMARRIRDGAKAVPPALRAMDAAAGEARAKVQNLAASTGSLGTVLTALGPAGIAVAAGLGVATLGVSELWKGAHQATDMMNELVAASLRTGVSTKALQEWRFAAVQMGYQATVVDAALSRFAIKLGELKTGLGQDAKGALATLGLKPSDLIDVDRGLTLIAERLSGVGRAAERAAIANKLGVVELLPLLEQGADAIENLRRQARDLGIVLDEDLVRRGYNLSGAWAAASQALDINFKAAMVDFAPVAIETIKYMAEMARWTSDLVDGFRELDARSVRGLNKSLTSVNSEIAALEDMNSKIGMDPRAFSKRRADLEAQRARILEEILSRSFEEHERRNKAAAGAKPFFDPNAGKATAEQTALKAQIEAIRKAADAREKLLAVEAQFPGIVEAEAKDRVALADAIGAVDAARAQGIVSSDAEAESLRAMARATFGAAQMTRAHEAAQRAGEQAMRDAEEAQRAQIELLREQEERTLALQAAYDDWRGLFDLLADSTTNWGDKLVRIADEILPRLIAQMMNLPQPDSGTGGNGVGDLISAGFAALFGGPMKTPQGFADVSIPYAGGRGRGGWVEEGSWVDVGEHGPEKMALIGGRAYVQPGPAAPAPATVKVTVINQTATPVDARTERGPDGDLRVVLREVMRSAVKNGELDAVNRARYGLRPVTG